jgi:hypothetical protein
MLPGTSPRNKQGIADVLGELQEEASVHAEPRRNSRAAENTTDVLCGSLFFLCGFA